MGHTALLVVLPGLFDVGVGHSGDVVGNGAGHSLFCDSSLVIERKQLRVLRPRFVKRFHDMIGAFMFSFEGGRLIEPRIQVFLSLGALFFHFIAEASDSMWCTS